MTVFEKIIIISQGLGSRLLSRIYRFLLVMNPVQDRMRIFWAHDLGVQITPQDWVRIVQFNQSFSVNVGIKDNRYKLLNRWYYTPSKLAEMYENTSDVCWRCGNRGANFWHVWWQCSSTKRFLKQTHGKLKVNIPS